MMTIEHFKEARNVLRGVLNETRLIHSPFLSQSCGNQVYLKPENMQVTGAYKIRGAYYKISTMSEEEKSRGLVTASAGNHAQGVAYAARAAGVPATIVMPTTTPLMKVNNTKDYGAQVILHGDVFDEAAALAAKMSEEQGLTYVHPFNDLEVATGQGTIAYGCVHPGQAAQPQRAGDWRGACGRRVHEGQSGRGPCGHPPRRHYYRGRRGGQNPR